MTVKQKERAKWWSELIPKAITPGLLLIIIWKGGIFYQEFQNKSFDSIEDKVNTKNHVDHSLNPIEIYDLQQHIGNPDFHMAKQSKDSAYVTRPEFEDLIARNAVTNYQKKEEMKEIKSTLRSIQREVGVIANKVK